MVEKSISYISTSSSVRNLILFVKILTPKRLCTWLTLVATSLTTADELGAKIRKELPYSNCFEETAKRYKLDS